MQKVSSPPAMRGRKKSFCSSVPYCMMVGPTVLMVSIGMGAPSATDSSNTMNCSTAERPRPPYWTGQPTASQPSLPIWRTIRRCTGPTPGSSAPSSARTSSVSNSA